MKKYKLVKDLESLDKVLRCGYCLRNNTRYILVISNSTLKGAFT